MPWDRPRANSRIRRVAAASFAVAAVLLGLPAKAETPPRETAAGRGQARLCERLDGEAALAACRAALDLGIEPRRRVALRDLIAKKLTALEKWGDLVAHFREGVALDPQSAEARYRLGSALLFVVDRVAEAVDTLREAVRLAPSDASYWSALGIALEAQGLPIEARAAFEEALRLDATVLDGRPATQAVREAAEKGESWP